METHREGIIQINVAYGRGGQFLRSVSFPGLQREFELGSVRLDTVLYAEAMGSEVVENARAAAQATEARVEVAKAQVEAAEARVEAANARVEAAEARVDAAKAWVNAAEAWMEAAKAEAEAAKAWAEAVGAWEGAARAQARLLSRLDELDSQLSPVCSLSCARFNTQALYINSCLALGSSGVCLLLVFGHGCCRTGVCVCVCDQLYLSSDMRPEWVMTAVVFLFI